jgi:hypothetical protein
MKKAGPADQDRFRPNQLETILVSILDESPIHAVG